MIDLAELEIGLYFFSGTGRLLPHLNVTIDEYLQPVLNLKKTFLLFTF